MTASAPIVGTLRTIPDAASAPPPDSGAPAHANFRSVLEQYQSSRESASDSGKTKDTRQQNQKDSTATSTLPVNPIVPQAVTPPVEAHRLILPFTTSITLRQDTTASPDDAATQDSTTATDPTPQPVGTATTVLPPAIFQNAFDLRTLALGSDLKTVSIPTMAQLITRTKWQAGLSKDSAPSQAPATPDLSTLILPAPAIAPMPLTSAAELQLSVHIPAAPAAPQDSSAAAAPDASTVLPPVIEGAEDTTAAPPQGSLAFAARLSPNEETPAPAPDAGGAADSQPRAQVSLQGPFTAKQALSEADQTSDAHNGESGSQSSDQEKMSDRFAKAEMLLPQMHAASTDQPSAAPASHASSTSPLSPAARMDQVLDPPATAPSGKHDITIRIPDSNTDQGTAVRFVERAGEVHVSVRTSDTEMAQTLRGGLNELVTRLEDGGIRTQVWQPGSDAPTSQNNSQQPFADPDGSNGRQYSSGSNSEQESKQQNKPRWVEELEGSIGAQNSKETPQLWQA